MLPELDYDLDPAPHYEEVPLEAPATGSAPCVPEAFRSRILIDAVHDGAAIPAEYRLRPDGSPRVDPEALRRAYAQERDWGAGLVAQELARSLGLRSWFRVRVARALLDFNRFPGSTAPGPRDHMDRHAINPPFSATLGHQLKMRLLEEHYDRISDGMEAALVGRLIKIGIHTYDERNPTQTKRPVVSLISQPASYAREHRMRWGIFDPLYPDVLAESTCSRVLRDRISLTLERAGYRVGHNHPYLLPEGSIEVRTQVWYFFNHLRDRFEAAHPDSRDDPAFGWVWTMLLNTNLRLQEGEALRGYLHRYRRPRQASLPRYRAAQKAYARVSDFLTADPSILRGYRRSYDRPSSLVIEVRKDVVCELDPATGLPRRYDEGAVRALTGVIAGAIDTYLETDRDGR